jgi:hypothetical protein
MSALVCVARIGAAHGVRGAVKLWTFTEDPFAIKRYGPLLSKDGKRQFEVAQAREARDHLVATFKGVTTRDEAERLNGIELYVAREKLPATDAPPSPLTATRSAASSRSTISAPATSSRSLRPKARRCCCRLQTRWCRKSISQAAAS